MQRIVRQHDPRDQLDEVHGLRRWARERRRDLSGLDDDEGHARVHQRSPGLFTSLPSERAGEAKDLQQQA